MSWGDKKKTSSAIQQAGQMTPEEQAQYQGSFQTGQTLDQIYQAQMGMGQYPQGYLQPEQQFQQQGPLAQAMYGQTLSQMQNPDASYMSTLNPQLKLAEDYINNKMNQRGLLPSGMSIENMGRAGAELAVQEAQGILQNRANVYSQAGNLSQYAQGQGQQNLMSLQNLYGQQQQIGQPQRQTAIQYQAYPLQAQLGSIYGGEAAMQALPGQLIGAAGQVAGAYANPYGTALSQLAKKTGGTQISQPGQ